MKNADIFLPFYQGRTKVLGLWIGKLGTVTKLKNRILTWNHVFTQLWDFIASLPFHTKKETESQIKRC